MKKMNYFLFLYFRFSSLFLVSVSQREEIIKILFLLWVVYTMTDTFVELRSVVWHYSWRDKNKCLLSPYRETVAHHGKDTTNLKNQWVSFVI